MPAKGEDLLNRDEVKKVCASCARKMKAKGITRVKRRVLTKKLAEAKAREVADAVRGTAVLAFHASWCKICEKMEPEVLKLAETLAGKATLVRVDVDTFSAIANEYRIKNLPVVAVVKKGVEKRRWTSDVKPQIVVKFVKSL